MNLRCLAKLSLCISLVMICDELHAQSGIRTNGSEPNNIITAVPFLLITPDARAGGMGDAGVAVHPDANTMSINPSKPV